MRKQTRPSASTEPFPARRLALLFALAAQLFIVAGKQPTREDQEHSEAPIRTAVAAVLSAFPP